MKTKEKDLSALLGRLWKQYGWSTYEVLIDPCELVKNEDGRWTFVAPNRFHARLLEDKLRLHWWRVVRPETDKPARSKLREAYDAWVKAHPEYARGEEEGAEHDRREKTTGRRGRDGFCAWQR